MDDQIPPDEPVTPAPIFAYRAFKEFFFGNSGESKTPLSQKTTEPNLPSEYLDFIDKTANPRTSLGQGPSAESFSTAKESREVETQDVVDTSDEMTLTIRTPKPKSLEDRLPELLVQTPQQSPTKGILRTPGQATSRAQSLKDVNVTFKGVSPELSNVLPVQALDHLPSTGAVASQSSSVVVNNGQSKGKERAASIIAPLQDMTSSPGKGKGRADDYILADPTTSTKSGEDVNNTAAKAANVTTGMAMGESAASMITVKAFMAYQAKTEKEIKALIGYGQKMKKYAYMKDQENEQLRKDIARLEAEKDAIAASKKALMDNICERADRILGPKRSENILDIPITSPYLNQRPRNNPLLPHLPSANVGQDHLRTEGNVADSVAKAHTRKDTYEPFGGVPLPKGTKSDSPLARYYAGQRDFLSGDPSRGGIPHLASVEDIMEAYKKRPKIDMEDMLKQAVEIAYAPEDSEFKRMITHPKTHAANKLRAAEAAAAENTGMPPERSAAARERLRQKAEVRKASNEK